MKEIKFRVPWSKDGAFAGFTYWGYLEERNEFVSPSQRPGLQRGDDEQYTGLKDKNGREIYEGDIIRLRGGRKPRNGERPFYVTDVIFDRGLFKARENKTQLIDQATIWFCEVLGNINENPELLK